MGRCKSQQVYCFYSHFLFYILFVLLIDVLFDFIDICITHLLHTLC